MKRSETRERFMFRDPAAARSLPVSPPTGKPVRSTKPARSTTERALAVLAAAKDGLVASMFGAEMWPERTSKGCSNGGGGDFAAQMLLGRLRKQGLVRVQHGSITSVWELTETGRQKAHP